MTTREKAQKLLDELPEDELEPVVEILASRGEDNTADTRGGVASEEPEIASVPASWGWDKTAWGTPMPNVVAWVDQSRQGR